MLAQVKPRCQFGRLSMRCAPDSEAAAAIHTGTTCHYVVDTSLILAALQILRLFGERVAQIFEHLDDRSKTFGEKPLTGRTRLQAALSITAGDRLDDW